MLKDSREMLYPRVSNQIFSILNIPVKSRDIKVIKPRQKIVTLIGPRRAGKTYLMIGLAKRVFKKLGSKQVFYLNLEDERVLEAPKEYVNAIDDFLHDADFKRPVYMFLDEVQNLKDWDYVVARIHARYPKVRLYLTGSNSSTLSSDIATTLRGRTLAQYVPTLNFKEFIRFKRKSAQLKQGLRPSVLVSRLFYEYLTFGGFPEVVLEKLEPIKKQILREYFDVLLFRDVIERFSNRFINPKILRFLIERVAENVTKPTSVNKIYNQLKSLGYKVDKNDLYDYLNVLQDVLFLQGIKKYHKSSIKRENSLKKYYFIDVGYMQILKFITAEDYGKLLENLVYLELKKRYDSIFYLQNGYECDFVVIKDQQVIPIQVVYHLSIDNIRRETRALYRVMRYTGARKGRLIFATVDKYVKNLFQGGLKSSALRYFNQDFENIEFINVLEWFLG